MLLPEGELPSTFHQTHSGATLLIWIATPHNDILSAAQNPCLRSSVAMSVRDAPSCVGKALK